MKNLITIILIVLGGMHLQAQNVNDWITGEGKPSKTDIAENVRNVVIDFANLNPGPVQLNPYYQADDGSYVFVRQIGDMVYAMADRFDRRFSSVWIGKVEGSTVHVKYCYIPKGKAKGNGKLRFNIVGRGRAQKWVLDNSDVNKLFNFNIKSMKTMSRLPGRLPVDDRAWYRGNSLDNLTGRWKIDNVGISYFLDLGGKIIVYTRGGRENAHSRPQFATVFFGERKGTRIEGHYVDLPLGHTLGAGQTAFKVIGPHFIKGDYSHFYYGVNQKRILEDKREIITASSF